MNLSFLPFLLLMLVCVPQLGTLLFWPVCRMAGVPVEEVKLFIGPRLAAFQMFGSTVVMGIIPAGGSLRFDVPAFEEKPPLLRLALLLLWPMVLLAGAFILLGHEQTIHHFTTGFSQLFAGVLHPLSTAQELIARLEAVHAASASAAAGVMLAKATTYMFFPLLNILPMQCLCFLVGPVREGSALDKVRTCNGFIALFASMSWAVAILTYSWRVLV